MRPIPLAGDLTPEQVDAFAHSRDALDDVPPLVGRIAMGDDSEAAPSPFSATLKPEDESKLLERVKRLVYADDPLYTRLSWADGQPLPPRDASAARDAIARGDEAAAAEAAFYPRRTSDSADRWERFWALNRRWRRAEAWLGATSAATMYRGGVAGFARWIRLWKSFSHDFKRGIDRADPVELEATTRDMETELGWYGYPGPYHPKDSSNKGRVRAPGEGLWQAVEGASPARAALPAWAMVTLGTVVVVGAITAALAFRGGNQ